MATSGTDRPEPIGARPIGRIYGIGVDVVDLERFSATLERTPEVQARLFTPAEAALSLESKAARFAAKEALVKGLRAGEVIAWKDIEVVNDERGAPSFRLHGSVADRVNELRLALHLSISHDAGVATAFVIAELLDSNGPA